MKANETIIQPMIEGKKQFVIPLFQRTYSWSNQQWKQLWEDILDTRFTDEQKSHFIGSIVSMSIDSAPHEVQKYLVIDGQQRLTTLTILLTVIRDLAKESHDIKLSEEIHENLLVNKWENNESYYKLLPTQVDRSVYKSFIDSNDCKLGKSSISQAYNYFRSKVKKSEIELKDIKTLVSSRLSLVSIVLASDDNPYLVFESLNAKGRPLTQADLIRNFFFMRTSQDKHEEVYRKYWKPMQDFYDDTLTEYIRHYLMIKGKYIRKNDVYMELKDLVGSEDVIVHLEKLYQYSNYYRVITHPDIEPNEIVRRSLHRINRLEATTSYPFLLNLVALYKEDKLSVENLKDAISLLENYLIRRFVCNVPTNELNKIFPSLLHIVEGVSGDELLEKLKAHLQNRGYPKDQEFRDKLISRRLYGNGDRARKTKFILESIEESYKHKERINYDNLTIEHIMPQTITDSWKTALGEDRDDVHENYLHVIGNLTLTAYNSEMSNDSFQNKQTRLADSHLEINKAFRKLDNWGLEEIKTRTNNLTNRCLKIWSYFGSKRNEIIDVKGTTPRILTFMDKNYEVSSWKEVWVTTLNEIILIDGRNFALMNERYANLFSIYINKFKRRGLLGNDIYVNVDFSARDVKRLCLEVLELVGIAKKEWRVEVIVS